MRLFIFSFLLLSCRSTEKSSYQEEEVEQIVKDEDGDGFSADEDCDDLDNTINPSATETCDGIDNNCNGEIDEEVLTTYYVDADEDGFGNPDITTDSCEPPTGFVENGSDCNDTENTVYPSAEEICDELDNDCNGEIDEGLSETFYVDADGDGFGDPTQPVETCLVTVGLSTLDSDCDDGNPDINPLVAETCDEVDNNCDGNIDEGVTTTFYRDADEDGFGTNDDIIVSCEQPEGYTSIGGDCDDVETFTNPIAIEICDQQDNDCDGDIDEAGATGEIVYYTDADGDGFGDDNTQQQGCEIPVGQVPIGGDCDDTTALKNPAAFEVCDGLDNDCDSTIDDNAIDESTWYLDFDLDGFGDASTTTQACDLPSGHVANSDDCDDTNENTYPGAVEYCNGIDDDCNGITDESTSVDQTTWYLDFDGDGSGSNAFTLTSCEQPTGYVLDSDDCDDTNANVYPNNLEVCDEIDNDCDLLIDQDDPDFDTTSLVEFYLDADQDGFGDSTSTQMACTPPTNHVANDQDCDDGDETINPSASEICDTIDNDCDGEVDTNAIDAPIWYLDDDEDGFGEINAFTNNCEEPTGYVANSDDCDDTDASIYPNAPEICDGIDRNCDGSTNSGAIGSDSTCSAATCQEILDDGASVGDGLYWLDPDQDGDFSDAWQAYCDMSRDGGGWTKIESALWPYFFPSSGWETVGSAEDANYSIFSELYDLADNGVYTFRYEVGNSGDWTSNNRAHYTIWSQEHHPAYETTDGSDYVYIAGEESTTCGGFNGMHGRYYAEGYPYTVVTDADSNDSISCWWHQILPLQNYNNLGYLEGYNGPNYHYWHSFWIR